MTVREVLYRVKTSDGRILDVLDRSPLSHTSVTWRRMVPGQKFSYGGTEYEFVEAVAS